ncbi:MAG: hypothetical protein M1136_10485 [Chloroflexi bacterium]|nr:hypothetical protein [Chloroflexota bacterium]MCL5076055.1 hypothetical protein [Chloroflexota bacterium]
MVLTLISTIMLPLAVVSGVYGMNIEILPIAKSQHSFLFTMGIMMVIAVAMLGYLRYRRWI